MFSGQVHLNPFPAGSDLTHGEETWRREQGPGEQGFLPFALPQTALPPVDTQSHSQPSTLLGEGHRPHSSFFLDLFTRGRLVCAGSVLNGLPISVDYLRGCTNRVG